MLFYPTVPVTRERLTNSVYTKVVCLKPENVQEGSRALRTAKEVLDENYGVQDDEPSSEDDESSAERAFRWGGKAALASVVGMVVGFWLGL
jgi:hypothetical protein